MHRRVVQSRREAQIVRSVNILPRMFTIFALAHDIRLSAFSLRPFVRLAESASLSRQLSSKDQNELKSRKLHLSVRRFSWPASQLSFRMSGRTGYQWLGPGIPKKGR